MDYNNITISLEEISQKENIDEIKSLLAELTECRINLQTDHPDAAKAASPYCYTSKLLNELIRAIREKIKRYNINQNILLREEAKMRRVSKQQEISLRRQEERNKRLAFDEQNASNILELKKLKYQSQLTNVFMSVAKRVLDKKTYETILENAQHIINEQQTTKYNNIDNEKFNINFEDL